MANFFVSKLKSSHSGWYYKMCCPVLNFLPDTNDKIIKKDSIIFLTTENKNFPNFTIKLISNELEVKGTGYILNLHLEKEIIVKDNNNILKSGWAGFRWQKDIYNRRIKYGNSVTIGRTYNLNKIYIEIKTFIDTKKINLFLISV